MTVESPTRVRPRRAARGGATAVRRAGGEPWAPYRPGPGRPWNLRLAGHLTRRAAFGADWQQLQQVVADGPQRAIDRLLAPDADVESFNRKSDELAAAAARSDSAGELRAWWLRRMIQTPHPLLEKMTLFWHGYFGISNHQVHDASLMQRHVATLRQHALGRFDELADRVVHDPALLAGKIVLQQPAAPRRVVAELYRWLISETTPPDSKNLSQNHVGSPPRLGNSAVRSSFAAGSQLLEPLAKTFAQNFDIARLVETMLRSNLFFSSRAYRQRIKSPIEMALGIVKGLERMIPTVPLAHDLAVLGQNLYHPPTAGGWSGRRHWIDAATICGRSRLAFALLGGTDRYGRRLDADTIARKNGFRTPRSAARFLVDLFLQGDLDDGVRDTLLRSVSTRNGAAKTIRELAHTVVTLPEFHLS